MTTSPDSSTKRPSLRPTRAPSSALGVGRRHLERVARAGLRGPNGGTPRGSRHCLLQEPGPAIVPLVTSLELAGAARDLSLGAVADDAQDWGIEMADPARVDEFISYCSKHWALLSPRARAELTDLVLQSAEEAMEARTPFNLEGLRRFATTADPDRLRYWLGLQPADADPWLVSAQLRNWAEANDLQTPY